MELSTYDLAATAMGYSFLSPEVFAAMKVSLPVLQKEYGFSKMYAWGKLKGMSADYIIAVGVSHSLKEATKKYFYCSDGASWAQMAEPDSETAAACAKIPQVAALTGDAQFVYTVSKMVPEGEEPPENEEDLLLKITEDVRAACLVKEIDAAIAMVPVGSISTDAKLGVPVPDSTFAGLSKEASLSLASWELLNGMSATQQLAGSLKAKYVPAASLTVLRSLVWPGFAAFCVPGSRVSGYAYVGDGMQNSDVAFCLP
ncbi:hypothetical protein KFE25_006116 [Diacronema lutheri]|uniref:Radial spoke head protein 9 homolog n=1 Tax=Diacronema lutheri TaxID=2081491 RepID=A0A8J5XIG9_DIALT|nr:hypothetical protein KFE25_006116 [Diacronema lutheri]